MEIIPDREGSIGLGRDRLFLGSIVVGEEDSAFSLN